MKRASGSSLARTVLAASLGLAALIPEASAREAAAAPLRIEAGTLSSALAAIARSAGVEIVSLERGLAAVAVPARTLAAEPARALAQLLSGTDYRAVRVGPRAWRIERARAHRAAATPPPLSLPPEVEGPTAITVVAGKFPTRLADYPGQVVRIPAADGSALPVPGRLDELAMRSPVVFSTAFGDGRNKLFIRGIADSSFNGASQPTTAIYFDDTPIGFGSPNPNLRLHDVASVEVLEGPQGTLFGGGSIGGVIRITPNPVDLRRVATAATAELSHSHGLGWDLSGTVNLPVLSERAGLRVVGYHERQDGFIADPGFGSGLNRVDVVGTRGALAVEPAAGWHVDLGGLFQRTHAWDAQYADATGALARMAAVRQPYRNELVLGRAGLRRSWDDGLQLAAVLSYGHRSSFERFDATPPPPAPAGAMPSVYDVQRSSSAWVGEVRLSRQSETRLGWVVGLDLERLTDGQSRALGDLGAPPALDEVTNITRSASAFAQARWPLTPALQATVGLRFTAARTDSEPARGRIVSYIRGGTDQHFDPTLALLWRIDPRLSAFARFQTGYRNGGVTVARGVGRVSDFRPDSIAMGELGMRRRRLSETGLELSGSVSYARWNNVLAELVTRRGTPITSNIGNARIVAVEGAASYRLPGGWSLGAQAMWTHNRLSGDLAMQTTSQNRHLPDTPALSALASVGYEWRRGTWSHAVSASARYVGRSVLGPGALLDLSQGNYAVVDAGLVARQGGKTFQLSVDNITNTHANRFALGNPLLLTQREGFVPVAPRRVAVSVSIER